MPKPVHGSGGYNIKVREVENGFTIHYTEIMDGGREEHKNLIAWDEDQVMQESFKLHRDWCDRNRPKGAEGSGEE